MVAGEPRKAHPSGGDFAMRLKRVQPVLRRHLSRVEVLAEVVRSASAVLETDCVAEVAIDTMAGWIPAPSWGLFLLDGDELRLARGRALPASLGPAAQALARVAILDKAPYTSGDLGADPRLDVAARASAVALPLACRGRAIGAIVGLDREPSAARPRLGGLTGQLLGLALEAIAGALDAAVRLQRIEALSVTDDLTQLFNSRFLHLALRRETKRSARSGRPLSLLFIDLDGFKSINDSHGHLCGSRALVEAANVIRNSARETDVVARFGGDEFSVVLPDTGPEGAIAVAERVRAHIAAHPFLAGDGLDIHLTASVGVATLPDAAASAEALIQAADLAMYWVKEHGKNGIHVATG
jgi:diguanylate cyclase (GGDEF)-like protein